MQIEGWQLSRYVLCLIYNFLHSLDVIHSCTYFLLCSSRCAYSWIKQQTIRQTRINQCLHIYFVIILTTCFSPFMWPSSGKTQTWCQNYTKMYLLCWMVLFNLNITFYSAKPITESPPRLPGCNKDSLIFYFTSSLNSIEERNIPSNEQVRVYFSDHYMVQTAMEW